jgi:AraC-like DNA-binding protein
MDTEPGLLGVTLQRIESNLNYTVWRLAEPGSRARAVILLEDGEGQLEAPDVEPVTVTGPSLHWLVRAGGMRFRAEAGSIGYVGAVGETFLAQLNTGYADSLILSLAADRDHHSSPDAADDIDVRAILATIHRELQMQRVGSPIVLAAQVQVLLVAMSRLDGLEVALEGAGVDARFLRSFRSLLESNFRAHWPVRRYAERIGISHDRLHSICRRKLGRTPKALIAERLAREAAQGLERSTLSLEQLSYALGFRDPAHFSHFFKRVMGLSPGAYRRRTAAGTAGNLAWSPANFADWP